MSLGKAIDIEGATAASLNAHVELYRSAALGGDAEAMRTARLACEAALEARLDAVDGLVSAQRQQRRRLGF